MREAATTLDSADGLSAQGAAPTGGLMHTVVALCFLLMVCDSYNVAAMAYAAPAVMASMRLAPPAMGLVFSAGLTGLLVGSLAIGRLGDRIGRKRAIVWGAVAFSVLTLATAAAADESTLAILRFLAGIGLGGVVPNAIALVGEFAPPRLRATAVGLVFSGYAAGGILAGLVAAVLVPVRGWPSLFIAGGVASLIVTAVVARWLPESRVFLRARESVLSGRSNLTGSGPNVSAIHAGSAMAGLFRGSLRLATPLLWATYVLTSVTVFSLASWMPALITKAGSSAQVASVATALLYTGGAIGGVIGGRLADRYGFRAAAGIAIVALPLVAAIGLVLDRTLALYLATFLAGAATLGGQTTIHGLVPSLYDTRMRATGAGWGLGIGKVGSILGPVLGGFLLVRLSPQQIFVCAAAPLAPAFLLLMALHLVGTRHGLSEERA